MIFFFPDKLAGKPYKFVRIDSQTLAESRAEETLQCYEIVLDFQDFQVALFKPGSEILKTSPCLCLCDLCVLNWFL